MLTYPLRPSGLYVPERLRSVIFRDIRNTESCLVLKPRRNVNCSVRAESLNIIRFNSYLEIQVSLASIITPMLHIHLHQHGPLTNRTEGRCLETSQSVVGRREIASPFTVSMGLKSDSTTTISHNPGVQFHYPELCVNSGVILCPCSLFFLFGATSLVQSWPSQQFLSI